MTRTEPISELDLLAYAEGQLDHDPSRKAQVEDYLRAAPEAAERARAYSRQTRALREAYGARAMEPVPDRLHAVLRPPLTPGRMRAVGLRAAAMVAVSTAAGIAGWYIGQVNEPAPQVTGQRLPSVLQEAVSDQDAGPRSQQPPASAVETGGIMRWQENGVGVGLAVPDLSSLGYEVSGRRNAAHAETQSIALTYRGAEGELVRLFIAPVALGEGRVVSVTREGDAPVAHWSQGPLTIAMQAESSGRDIAALARDIRDTIARAAREPRLPQYPVPRGQVEVTADAMSPPRPREGEPPAAQSAIIPDTAIE